MINRRLLQAMLVVGLLTGTIHAADAADPDDGAGVMPIALSAKNIPHVVELMHAEFADVRSEGYRMAQSSASVLNQSIALAELYVSSGIVLRCYTELAKMPDSPLLDTELRIMAICAIADFANTAAGRHALKNSALAHHVPMNDLFRCIAGIPACTENAALKTAALRTRTNLCKPS